MALLQILLSLRIYNKTTTGQDNWEQTKNLNKEVIFIGNSRCIGSIDPEIFEINTGLSAINLGSNGQDNFQFMSLRIDRYLYDNRLKPKYIFVLCEPSNSTKKQFFQKDLFARYAYFNLNSKNSDLINYFEFNLLEKNIPLYSILKYRRLIDCLTLLNKSTWEIDGYSKFYGTLEDNKITSFDKSIVHRDNNLFYKQLDEFRDKYKSKGIEIIAFQLPILGFENLKNTIYKNEKKIRSMSIPFFNIYLSKFLKPCYFSDRYHPNFTGAELFTKTLAERFSKSPYKK